MKEHARLLKWKSLLEKHMVDYIKRQSSSEEEYHKKMANPFTRPNDCPMDGSWMASKSTLWWYLETTGKLPTKRLYNLRDINQQITDLQPKLNKIKRIQRGDMTKK